MNRVINIYASIDSFFDYRRGLLQYLMTKDVEDPDKRKYKADKLWEMHIADNYRKRRMDTFSYPQFNIDRDKFLALYKQRSTEHWEMGMYYPTPLISKILSIVIDLEGLTEKPIDISEMKLFINVFPYQFTNEQLKELAESVRVGLKGTMVVKTIYSDPNSHDSRFYGQYQYIFDYNLITDETSTLFMEGLTSNPIPDTAAIVPDILIRETETFKGPVKDWMFGAYTSLSPLIRLIPTDRSLFDYA